MINLHVDFDSVKGPIKAMHGVGQPPIWGMSDEYFHYLDEAHIPYSRLHDVGGNFGGNMYVDIPNVFRDFDKDPEDPASYDFAFTDVLMKNLQKHGVEPIYRLGVTIENYKYVKPYRIYPPKSAEKWAKICEHVVRHYNEGWADGFHLGITYWEIWNEPDNDWPDGDNQMWLGTKEEYYELYTVTAKHLKACFGDTIKVGGFASCGMHIASLRSAGEEGAREGIPSEVRLSNEAWIHRLTYFHVFFEGFFQYIKEHQAPIDFFSWHSYDDPEKIFMDDEYIHQKLVEFGYGDLETQMNEWNPAPRPELRGTSKAASEIAAVMLGLQDRNPSILCYYDARMGVSVYGGLFNPLTTEPFLTYYSMKAFGELYALGTQVNRELTENGQPLSSTVYAVAAKGCAGEANGKEKKEKRAVMLANTDSKPRMVETDLEGYRAFVISDTQKGEISIDSTHFTLPEYGVMLLMKEE